MLLVGYIGRGFACILEKKSLNGWQKNCDIKSAFWKRNEKAISYCIKNYVDDIDVTDFH